MTATQLLSAPVISGRGASKLLPATDMIAAAPIGIQMPGDVWNYRVGTGWGGLNYYDADRGGGTRFWTKGANQLMEYNLGVHPTGSYELALLYRMTPNSGRAYFEIWQYPIDGTGAGQRVGVTLDLYAAAVTRQRTNYPNVTLTEDSRVLFRVTCLGTKQAASADTFIDFVGIRWNRAGS